MARTIRLLPAVLLGVVAISPIRAEIYRWTDASGHEHFTSRLSDVPEAQRGAATQGVGRRGGVNRIDATEPAPAAKRAPTAAAPAKIGGDDEAGWRARAKKLRSDIARLAAEVANCQASAPVRWKPGAGSRAYRDEAREAQSCQRHSDDLKSAKLQLAKLEQNAHKLGVPPGWVR